MSDDEHHFESSDAGASKTYPQQAGNIRKGGHIVIKGRPCKVCLQFDSSSWIVLGSVPLPDRCDFRGLVIWIVFCCLVLIKISVLENMAYRV